MKTIKYYKLLASIVMVSILSTFTVNLLAQRRSHNEESTRYDETRRNKHLHDSKKRDKYNKSTYNYRDNNESHHQGKYYKKKSKHDQQQDHFVHKNHHKHKNHKSYHHEHVKFNHAHKAYYRGYHKNHSPYYKYRFYNNRHGHSCYNHSRYGEVIREFACEPRVIHHHSGDYYYTDGCYYRFYPEFGFVRVEVPSVYFSVLPEDCHRVRAYGEVYYTNGDLCFVKHRKGFRLVTMPEGIHFSIRF